MFSEPNVFHRRALPCASTLFFAIAGTKVLAQARPLGCDVSNNQSIGLSWTTTVKGNGMSFAWAKATEGETYDDDNFTTYVANAKAAGVLIGAYHFAHPETHLGLAGADGEAAHFWSIAGKYITNGGTYIMPALDMETDVGTNSPVVYTAYTLSQWANRWCQDIVNDAAANGVAVKPVIYTFTSYSSEWFNSSVTNWPIWMASWPNDPNPQTGEPSSTSPWPGWTFWQWADTNASDGDSDVFNGNSVTISNMVIGSLSPPFFETPLVNSRAVDAGKSVNFAAQADGGLPLKFQWLFNGTNLPNATNTSLTIASTSTNNAGTYALVVANAGGAITSSVVSLIVYPLQTTVFSDNFDVNTATNWILNASSSDTAATFNYNYASVGIPSAPNSTNGTTRGLLMQANLANTAVAALSLSPTNRSFSGDYRVHFDAWINVNGPLPAGGTGSTLFLTGGLGTSGTRAEWSGNGSADGYYFACDGDGGVAPSSTGINDYNVLTGDTIQGGSSGYYLAGTDATARGFANLYYQSAITNAHAAPTSQQTSYPVQSTNALDPGKFGFAWHDVIVSKRGSTVDWVIDGVRYATIPNATFTSSNVFVGHWDDFASLSANNAINFSLVDNVRVEQPAAPPQFTLQPVAQTVPLGTNVTFTATATALPAATYQWQFNGTNIVGATNSTYAVAFVASTNAGNYSVIATNLAGSVTSTNAALALVSPDAAQFTSAGLQNGAVQINFSGNPYWTYTVEVSTNLTSWSTFTNMTSTNGVFNFNVAVTNGPQQFFRARVGP